jgi:hypothetical protein
MIYEWKQSRAGPIISMIVILVAGFLTASHLIRSPYEQSSLLPWIIMLYWGFGVVYMGFKLLYPSFIRVKADSIEYGNGLKTKTFHGGQIEKLRLIRSGRGNHQLLLCTQGWNYHMPYPDSKNIRVALIQFAKEHNIILDGDWYNADMKTAFRS